MTLTFYKYIFYAILFVLFLSCKNVEKTPNKSQIDPPNVVFILVDDFGWKGLGIYGSSFYETPNIDSLASQGVRFSNAYAASSVCSPTRAAIMTGKHPARVNITDWITGMSLSRAINPELIPPDDIHNLPLEEQILAESFKEYGYNTFFAGKWHLGQEEKYWPKHQGFDINKGGYSAGRPKGGYYSPYNNPRLENGPKGEYLTDRLTEESIEFIEKAGADPFFLFLSYYTVHGPIQGCKRYDEEFHHKKMNLPNKGKVQTRPEGNGETRLNQSNHKYAAMVKCMDENIGRLLSELKKRGEYENTIILFTSDNGGLTTRKSYGPTAETPLRAGKGWLYEGGIRIPLIVKGPGVKKGAVSDQPVTSMDLYPTLLQLAGLPIKSDQHKDGKSMVPYLKNPQRLDERMLVWHYPHYHGSTWRPGSAIRIDDWKLIQFYENNEVELYNLATDIGEQHDLSEEMPKKRKMLMDKLQQWKREMNAKIPVNKSEGHVN